MNAYMKSVLEDRIGMVCLLVLVCLLASTAFAQGPSTDEIKGWLAAPAVLYGLMIFGSVLSMLKQWGGAKMEGSEITIGSYLSHVQELLITLGTNTLAFFLLIDSGNLNFLSAVSIGYALNSLSDLNPAGSRSTAMAVKKE